MLLHSKDVGQLLLLLGDPGALGEEVEAVERLVWGSYDGEGWRES